MKRPPLSKKWTEEDVAQLEKLVTGGVSAIRAGAAMGRSTIAVQNKARDMGCPFPPRPRYTVSKVEKNALPLDRRKS